jgi:hypothetical protein
MFFGGSARRPMLNGKMPANPTIWYKIDHHEAVQKCASPEAYHVMTQSADGRSAAIWHAARELFGKVPDCAGKLSRPVVAAGRPNEHRLALLKAPRGLVSSAEMSELTYWVEISKCGDAVRRSYKPEI